MNKAEKQIVKAQLGSEDKTLKELQAIFKKAREDCVGRISQLNSRSDMQNLQSIIYQRKYQEAILKQIDSTLKELSSGQYKTVEQFLSDSYDNGYIGMMYDLQNQGIPITMPIDDRKVVQALTTDSQLSERYYQANPVKGRLEENVSLLKNRIRSNLSRGIVAGKSWVDVARDIATGMNNPFDTAMKDSMRIVRTEGHRVNQQGFLDAGNIAKSKGADIVKQWDSTLDGRTRAWHREADGQLREWDEDFDVMGEKLKAPSIGGSAANVCNCRCQLLQRARWALDESELKTLQERAEFYGLDKTDSFEEYKQKYLKLPEKADTKTIHKQQFVPAKTLSEAEEFISKYYDKSQFGAVGVSYDGIDVEVANEINRTLYNFFEAYDVGQFGGIIAPAGNTKLGKAMRGATAGYVPIRNSFLVNRKTMRNMKTAQKAFEGEIGALKDILEHPERYDLSKVSRQVRDVIERSKISGRATVPKTIEEALTHECGHMLEKKVKQSPLWNEALTNMPTYADKISGYAGQSASEYVAESFASYNKGEKVADPVLVKIFESLMR